MKEFVFSIGLWALFFGFILFVSRTEAESLQQKKDNPVLSQLKIDKSQKLFGP
jgi:hypothetical protein